MGNNDSVIYEISRLTKNWSLYDWKRFRSLNNYWGTKDRAHKQWYDKKRGRWNNGVYSAWLNWKLSVIKEYSSDNQ